jgi:Sodium/calcium exchanger protein
MSEHGPNEASPAATAGLSSSNVKVDAQLRRSGIDPDRLSVLQLGRRSQLSGIPSWFWRLFFGLSLWVLALLLEPFLSSQSSSLQAGIKLFVGLVVLVAACEILVSATERLAARFQWNHYIAGTLAEILSTTPELVVIAFVIPVSPITAFTICLVTIYNNALVFSLYSYFLPKDQAGKYVMPTPITEAGTQILIGGGSMGLILGLVMLSLNTVPEVSKSFSPADLIFISCILLTIFAVYITKLVTSYAKEEAEVRENLSMSDQDVEKRLEIVYANVKLSSFWVIAIMFLVGISGAFVGGHEVSGFASTMILDLDVNPILTALILALFAGMSEYVILWQSHRKQEYGIALANAFGGITQVMFLVLPFTLLCIALYQGFLNPIHPELPLEFSISNIFLLLFLFPTFYTLSSLLEEDHTLGILDTTIMTGIFLFLIVLLVRFGGLST